MPTDLTCRDSTTSGLSFCGQASSIRHPYRAEDHLSEKYPIHVPMRPLLPIIAALCADVREYTEQSHGA